MSWQESLKSLGPWHESPLGIGINFSDGFDTFWVLPGEPLSSLPVPKEGPADLKTIIAEYRTLDDLRTRALNAVRHHLVSIDAATDRRGTNWTIVLKGGVTVGLSVGAYLTKIASETRDVKRVIIAAIEQTLVGKTPSDKRLDRYLSTPGPPATEPPFPANGAFEFPSIRGTIRDALVQMATCRAFDKIDDDATRESVKASLEAAKFPTGPAAETMLHLASKLPAVSASCDLCSPGAISLEFDDGLDCFEISLASRPFLRKIQSDGPVAVGDALADQFNTLNAARSRILNAIYQAANSRGWKQQQLGLSLMDVETNIYLGSTEREVAFPAGGVLTKLLESSAPLPAIRQIFKDASDFAESVVTAFESPESQIAKPPNASLLPKGLPAAPQLKDLDAATIADLDAHAERALRDFANSEDFIWKYHNHDIFDPSIDTWMTTADWVRIAERHLEDEYPNANAIEILLDAGDPRGHQLAHKYLNSQEPHHEMGPAEVRLCWRFRHELPEISRRWFSPSPGEDVPFAEERAAVGDPIARRKLELDHHDVSELLDRHDVPEYVSAPPEQRDSLHAALLKWARTTHMWAGPELHRIKLARAFRWRDVAVAMQDNPYMLAGLLTPARRADQFDMPGMILAGEFLLAWSRLDPSTFLARLIATARSTDLISLAKQSEEAAAAGKPDIASRLGSSMEMIKTWMKQLEPQLAIAWTRCRKHL